MAICPFAEWRPLKENATQPRMKPTTVIWHTYVDGPTPNQDVRAATESRTDGIEFHFFIRGNGHIDQFIDTERTADANYKANGFAISVETEDDGRPDLNPWTQEQLDSIDRLSRWLRETHGIEPELCRTSAGGGHGYHSQFPMVWTPYKGKTCPGPLRIAQLKTVVLPRLNNPVKVTSKRKVLTMDVARDGSDGAIYLVTDRGVIHLKTTEEVNVATWWVAWLREQKPYPNNGRFFDVLNAILTRPVGLV